jgi:hypothetical protein
MTKTLGLQIIVLDRGFVYIGNVTVEDDFVRIDKAKNARVWGTETLGKLALDGPSKESSKLDDAGVVIAPLRAVIHFIECNTEKWR